MNFKPLLHIYMNDQFSDGKKRGWSRYVDASGSVYSGILPVGNKVLTVKTGTNKGSSTIKRSSWIWPQKVRLEAYLAWKNENNDNSKFSNLGIAYDIQKGVFPNENRRHFTVAYINSTNEWQYSSGIYKPIPGNNKQILPQYDSVNNKNWIYTRFDIHLGTGKYVEFQCNNRIWKINDSPVQKIHEGEGEILNNLINFLFWITTKDTNSPCYLYIDSICVSAQDNNWLENWIWEH